MDQCEQLALDGSAEAATNIGGFYSKVYENRKAIYWYGIAAENGDIQARLSQAYFLIHSPLASDRRRGRFWLRNLSKIPGFKDSEVAATTLLKHELKEKSGKPEVWDFPPNKW